MTAVLATLGVATFSDMAETESLSENDDYLGSQNETYSEGLALAA